MNQNTSGSDVVRPALSALEQKVFDTFTEADMEICRPMAVIGKDAGIPEHLTRRVIRAVARKGLIELTSLWDDDGQVRGRGYGLTDLGLREVIARTESSHA